MVAPTTKIDSLSDFENKDGGEAARWTAEIEAFEKEVGPFVKKSRKIVKQFRSEKREVSGLDQNYDRKFNLFAANVHILQTALLNQIPKPTADRGFKDPQDDVGRVACEILERALNTHNSRHGYRTYEVLKQVIQDCLVPGFGVSWHTYHADIEKKEQAPSPEQLKLDPQAKPIQYEEVTGEELKDDYVYWEDLEWSPCRVYQELRWMGRKLYLTKDTATKRFGKDIADKLTYDYTPKKQESSVETKQLIFQQAIVHEIWDIESKSVIWYHKGAPDLLDKKGDIAELEDFWPCPRPLFANSSTGQWIPIPDFQYASDQYRDLNETNTRIGLLVRACRVAGTYDKTSAGIPTLLNNAAENTLVPVDNWAMYAEKGGIKGMVDWLPLDQIVVTIDQLLKAREDIKNQIYELTGMSDILRGASKASETLGAQKIKAQYASMRIQERQKQVVMYASSVFNIQAQLLRNHMDPQEIAKLAQVQFMAEDQQLIQQALQLLKNPEFILRCVVEADSLSDIDFQAEKQDRIEFMTTITNYLKETMQTINTDPIMGPMLMQLLQFSLAGFKVGRKFEAELDRTFSQIQQKLSQPQQPQQTPEQQKAIVEIDIMQKEATIDQQNKQQELQFMKDKHQIEMNTMQQKTALEAQTAQQKAKADQQIQQQRAGQQQAKFWNDLHMSRTKAMEKANAPQNIPVQ